MAEGEWRGRETKSLALESDDICSSREKYWRSELNKFLLAYRSTAHTTTGKSLAELLYGRQIGTKLPELVCFADKYEATGYQETRL